MTAITGMEDMEAKHLKSGQQKTFDDFPELEHVGLTTWSGNMSMMKSAEKIGYKLEGRIRKSKILYEWILWLYEIWSVKGRMGKFKIRGEKNGKDNKRRKSIWI